MKDYKVVPPNLLYHGTIYKEKIYERIKRYENLYCWYG